MSKEKCNELGVLRYKTLGIEDSVMDPKSVLYNLDNCQGDTLVLVEGATDVWKWGDGCAATLGTSTTPAQHLLIANRFRRVLIMFDPEEEAQGRANSLYSKLNTLGVQADCINTELDHDMGAMTEEEVAKLKEEVGLA
jgi:DNA primase